MMVSIGSLSAKKEIDADGSAQIVGALSLDGNSLDRKFDACGMQVGYVFCCYCLAMILTPRKIIFMGVRW
tara:strand:- start:261 stop:470 length:210 start_codon:yes stop_codon:yes gene_type:complete